jgi:hypothetical protein
MYKLNYVLSGGNTVLRKYFKTLKEATEFANRQPVGNVLEIKLEKDTSVNKENRT